MKSAMRPTLTVSARAGPDDNAMIAAVAVLISHFIVFLPGLSSFLVAGFGRYRFGWVRHMSCGEIMHSSLFTIALGTGSAAESAHVAVAPLSNARPVLLSCSSR